MATAIVRDAMAQEKAPAEPAGDPWVVFGHLVSGVLLYGLLGWVLDRWIGTSFLVVVGILSGAGLGLYMTWVRFGVHGEPTDDQQQ
jgi:ATP synthase protein I